MKFCQLSVKRSALPGLFESGGLRSIIRSGEPQMILGLLRERLQGARRIPLSIGKCLVGFEPFRRILGAPHLSDRARADLAPSPRVSPESSRCSDHATE